MKYIIVTNHDIINVLHFNSRATTKEIAEWIKEHLILFPLNEPETCNVKITSTIIIYGPKDWYDIVVKTAKPLL